MYNRYVRSSVKDVLATPVRRSLVKFGEDLSVARRKRRLSIAMMCERLGVSQATWSRMAKGDPTVSMGAYAQALFVLGFGSPFDELVDPSVDERGLLLDVERLPRRVVHRRAKVGNET